MVKTYISLLAVAILATLSTCKHGPGVLEKCSLEHNVTEKQLNKFLLEFAEETDGGERRIKCFIKCLYDGLKLIDDNRRLDATKFGNQDYFEPSNEHLVEIAYTCNAKYSSVEDQCENIFKVVVCMNLQLQHEKEEQKVFELIRNNFTDVETK